MGIFDKFDNFKRLNLQKRHFCGRSEIVIFFITVPARETFRRHVVIANLDSVMEPLRSFMPNIIPVPGLFVKDPQLLKDEKHRTFMETTNNGVIVRTIFFFISSVKYALN